MPTIERPNRFERPDDDDVAPRCDSLHHGVEVGAGRCSPAGCRASTPRWPYYDRVEWFEDKENGTSLDRPVFNRILEAIFAGEIKTLVIWKLDRISRRQFEGLSVLADGCDRGVRVVSVTQIVDLREHRRERQAAGIRVAKKRGPYRGRKKGTRPGGDRFPCCHLLTVLRPRSADGAMRWFRTNMGDTLNSLPPATTG